MVQSISGVGISIVLRSTLNLLGALVMMGWTSWRLMGVMLVLIPVIMLPLFAVGRKVRRLSRASQDRIADSSGMAGETLNAMQTVQAFTLEELQSRRFDKAVEESFATAISRNKVRALLTAIGTTLVMAAITLVLWLGARAVLAGEMSGGQLGQFLLYAGFVTGSAAALIDNGVRCNAPPAQGGSSSSWNPSRYRGPAVPRCWRPVRARFVSRMAGSTSHGRTSALEGFHLQSNRVRRWNRRPRPAPSRAPPQAGAACTIRQRTGTLMASTRRWSRESRSTIGSCRIISALGTTRPLEHPFRRPGCKRRGYEPRRVRGERIISSPASASYDVPGRAGPAPVRLSASSIAIARAISRTPDPCPREERHLDAESELRLQPAL